MKITDEAAEAVARAIRDDDWPDYEDQLHRPVKDYMSNARAALEAAAPHMEAGAEWAIFPRGGPAQHAATDLRYETREAAEETRKESYLHPELFEVRGRAVGKWAP